MADLRGAIWRKSARSNNAGNCVEVATNLPGVVGARDSKDPEGPELVFGSAAWGAFTEGVKAGRFDLGR